MKLLAVLATLLLINVADVSAKEDQTAQGGTVHILNTSNSPVRTFALTRDRHTLVTASEDGAIALWQIDTGKLVRNLHQRFPKADQIDVSDDGGHVAVLSSSGNVDIWDANADRMTFSFVGEDSATAEKAGVFQEDRPQIALSPDGRFLAWRKWLWDVESKGPGQELVLGPVRMFIEDPETSAVLEEVRDNFDTGRRYVFSPDGRFLAASRCATGDGCKDTWLWAMPYGGKGTEIKVRVVDDVMTARLLFLPDDTFIAVDDSGTIIEMLINAATGKHKGGIPVALFDHSALDVSADGSTLLVSYHGRAELWNIPSRHWIKRNGPDISSSVKVTLLADGQTMAALGKDGVMRMIAF